MRPHAWTRATALLGLAILWAALSPAAGFLYGGYSPYAGYYPSAFYYPGSYGGYSSSYPGYGYGYPFYDFSLYGSLPPVPRGFFDPSWPGLNAPAFLWPNLYFGPRPASAPQVVQLPPVVIQVPEDLPPPAPPPSEGRGERTPRSDPGVSPFPASAASESGKGAGGLGRKGAGGLGPKGRAVTRGRVRVEWDGETRARVLWVGDPRTLGLLRVEELDARGRRLTERRVESYPFRVEFDRSPRTRSLRVTALAGDEVLTTAVFNAPARAPSSRVTPRSPGARSREPAEAPSAARGRRR